jgi:hypothetical protein
MVQQLDSISRLSTPYTIRLTISGSPSNEGKGIGDGPLTLTCNISAAQLEEQGILSLVALEDVVSREKSTPGRCRGRNGEQDDRADPVADGETE